MIRVLQVVTNMSRGGIETMLMNYYRNIDRNEIQFDFICNNKNHGEYEEEVLSLGGKIYWTPGLNPFKYLEYLRFFRNFVCQHPEYKIIHAHNDAFAAYALNAAKIVGIPIRIAHIHNAAFPLNYKLPLYVICRNRLSGCATHLWACGKKAAAFYYGLDVLQSGSVHIHNNAIDVGRYVYDSQKRKTIRENYGILESTVVIGHVGRFMKQKNHSFLLKIFREFHKMLYDSKLLLVGNGPLMDNIRSESIKLGISDSVIFAGSVPNPWDYYQCFDCFLMPSLHEGLPLSGIEAQAADLPCVFSNVISTEIDILHNASFLSLNSSPKAWSEEVLRLIGQNGSENRKIRMKEISNAGFNIHMEVDKLTEIYKNLYSNIK